MDDTPRTQRAFARAYGDGELDRSEAATALERYDELDAREQDAADELVAETGDDGTEFLAEADDDTVQRAVADGGIDGYDRTKADLLADDSVDSAMVTRVDDRISELDANHAERARDLIDDTDGAGVRLIDDLDAETRSQVLRDSNIDTDELARATRKYDGLDGDGDRAAQFRRFLDDDELRESWVRAVADDSVDAEGLRRTLDIAESVDDGVEIREFTSAQRAYDSAGDDDYLSSWYPERAGGSEEFFNPYSENGIVIDARTTSEDTVLVRAYESNGDSRPLGGFYTSGEDMHETIENPSRTLENRYATPGDQKDRVAIYEVDAGTNVRISAIGENFDYDGGGIQYEVRHPDLQKNTEEMDLSDFPGEQIANTDRDMLGSELDDIVE
jgi:hypothetical protein